MYRIIDMKRDPRRAQFEHFMSLQSPFVGVTVRTDVSGLARYCKERHFSFYAAMTRAVMLAGNRVPELRRRVVNGEVREYDQCCASITELGGNDLYYYCTLRQKESWEAFFPYAEEVRAERRKHEGLFEDEESDSQFFITCTPDLCFEQLILPFDRSVTNPMISWGRYEKDPSGRLMLPVSIIACHALADGVHISKFYRYLEEELKRFPQINNDSEK